MVAFVSGDALHLFVFHVIMFLSQKALRCIAQQKDTHNNIQENMT